MDEQLRSIGGQAKYLIDMVIRHPGWIYQGVFIDICTGSVQIREQNCRGCSQNAEPG